MAHTDWHQAPLFATLREDQRGRIQAMATSKRLAPDEILFFEGDPCTGFFVLVEGAIQLTRSSDVPGAHPTLAVILPVQSFAEAAMFGDEAFPATATALKPSRVFHFPKATILRTLKEDPALALAIIHAQSVWLRKLTLQIQELSASDSQGRLEHWMDQHLPASGATYTLPMTKKALAAQLGMTPETLSRALRTFQERGSIEVKGREFRRR